MFAKTLSISLIVLFVANELVKADMEQEPDDLMGNSTEERPENSNESTSDGSRELYEEPRVRILKEIGAAVLNDKCNEGECRDFIYDDPFEVAFFEAKPAVRFTSDTTYVFKESKQFEVLKFVDSKFANFPLNLFYSLKIHELDMRYCSIQHLTWDNFLMADKLTILLLTGNFLQEIKPMTFNGLEMLSFLFLDDNELDTLYPESFKELPKLYMLDLHDNNLESLPENVFAYLPALQQLNLAGNRLRVIGDMLFADNPRLQSVNLQFNAIEELGEYVFQNQQDMNFIGLSYNSPLQSVVGNMRVDNLWARNCSITRVNIYGKAKNVDFRQNRIMELYFSQPEKLETLSLSDNSLRQIASLSKATNLQYFDLSNNPQLETLPDFWEADSLERLDLSNTSLKTIPITVLASTETLKSLNVSNNRLTHIDPAHFKYFEKLNQLYIHRNNWNCFSLQLIMDMLITPWKISYNMDEYDNDFPGEYIGGIKCMYRLAEEDEDAIESSRNEPLSMAGLAARLNKDGDLSGQSSQLYSADTSDDEGSDVDALRRELKAIVGIYEQKFSIFSKQIEDLDQRLKAFERFNRTMWQHVTITV